MLACLADSLPLRAALACSSIGISIIKMTAPRGFGVGWVRVRTLLFPHTALNPSSLFAAGTRWSLQKFLFVGRFAEKGETPQDTVTTINPEPLSSWADCRNQDPTCDTRWRDYSCYTNQTYMLGNVTHPGECLSTCMRCDIWQEHLKLKAQQQQREDQLQQQQPQEQQQQQRSRRAGAPGPHSAPQSGSTAQPSQAVLR